MDINKVSENYEFTDTYGDYSIAGLIVLPKSGPKSVTLTFKKNDVEHQMYVSVNNSNININTTEEDFVDYLKYYVSVIDTIENYDYDSK